MVGQKIEPKTRLFEAMVGTTDEMEKKFKYLQVGFLQISCVLHEGLRLLKKLDLQRVALASKKTKRKVLPC